jgi:hypothetical protein
MGNKEIVKRELWFKLRTCGGTRKRGSGGGDRPRVWRRNLFSLSRRNPGWNKKERNEFAEEQKSVIFFLLKHLCFSTYTATVLKTVA